MTPAPKRRWFAFSLRTLFVVVTVFAVLSLMTVWAVESYEIWRELKEADHIILNDGL